MRAHAEPAAAQAAMAAGVCADCGAAVAGNYCAHCGQETRIETPTVRQFLRELVDQYVAVEGKLGRTLRVLLIHPGQLTRDYLEGRRQRYVRPLKLYLTISVAFFALLGAMPNLMRVPAMHVVHASPPAAPAAPVAPVAPAQDAAGVADAQDPEAAAEALAAKIEGRAREVSSLPPKQQNRLVRDKLINDGPYAMFLLLPYCAALLRWLFRQNAQRYGAHLLFALHLHCFAFIVLALFLALHGLPGWALWGTLAAYTFLALREVYGGSPQRLAWRTGLLALLYLPVITATAMSGVIGAVLGGKA